MKLKDVGLFSLITYLNQLGNIAINLLFIAILSPTMLGEVALAKVWMRGVDYSHLGIRFSIDRYAPICSKRINRSLLALCILVSSFVFFLILLFASIFVNNTNLIIVFLLWGYLLSLGTILKNYFRACGQNSNMVAVYFIVPVLYTVLQSIVLYFFGFQKFLIYTLSSCICSIVILLWVYRGQTTFQIKSLYAVFKKVRGTSTELFFHSILIFFTFAAERILISYFGGDVVLGKYSVVLFGFTMLQILPLTLTQLFFPIVVKNTISQSGNLFYGRLCVKVLIATMLFVLLVCFCLDYLIALVKEDYLELSQYIYIVALGVLPYAFTPIYFQVLNALDRRGILILISAVSFLLHASILILYGVFCDELLFGFTLIKTLFCYVPLVMCLIFLFKYNKRKEVAVNK